MSGHRYSMYCRALVAGVFLVTWPALPGVIEHAAEAATQGSGASVESNEFLESARDYLDRGNPNAAIIELKNALQADPENVEARFLLGKVYLDVGDGPSAEKELGFARDGGVAEAEYLIPLAQAYLLQRQYEKVLEKISSEEGDADLQQDILLVHGDAFVALGRLDEAERAYDEVRQQRPDDAHAHRGLAGVAINRNDPEGAEQLIDRALELEPVNAEALNLKGELRRLARDQAGALSHFDAALEVDPGNRDARIGRASTFVDFDLDDKAGPEIEAILERVPGHPAALYLSAVILAKAGDYAAAQETLLEGKKYLENHVPSVFLLGVVHFALGEYEQAQSNLLRYLDGFPDHLVARKLLGETYIRKNDPASAIAVLQPALAQAPNDLKLVALMGDALMAAGQYGQAAEMFERAMAIDPASTEVRSRLGESHLRAGELGQAIGILEESLERDPRQTRLGLLLALTHLQQGEFEKAWSVADRLEAEEPDNPVPHLLKGGINLARDDTAAARRDYEDALRVRPNFFPAENSLASLDIREGKLDQAIARYQAVLERDDRQIGAMMALAEIAQYQGQSAQALTWLEKASAARPEAVAPRIRTVDLLIQGQDFDRALSLAANLERANPGNFEAQLALARARLAAGQTESAEAAFEAALRLNPSSVETYVQLAQAQISLDHHDDARSTLNRAIALDAQHTAAYIVLAQLEQDSGRIEQALTIAETLERVQPDSPIGITLKGDILMFNDRFQDAVDVYAAGLEKSGTSELAVRLYTARAKAGDEAAAVASLEKWVEANPADSRARLFLADAHLRAHRNGRAIAHYEQLLTQAPNSPLVLNNLAGLYHEEKDPRALALAERAYALSPESAPVLDTLAWVLAGRGEAKRALPLIEKASRQMPDAPDIQYHYAVVLDEVGKREEAVRRLEVLLLLHKDFDSAGAAKAYLHKITKDQ